MSAPVRLLAALVLALAGTACSAKVEVGGDTTTTAARSTTTTEAVTDDTSAGSDVPPVGESTTVGPYTLTVVDPAEFGLSSDEGMDVAAATVEMDGQAMGVFLHLTATQGVFDDATAQAILEQQSSGGAVSPITVAGKAGYVAQNADGQFFIGRAAEDGSFNVLIGVPGATQDDLVEIIQALE